MGRTSYQPGTRLSLLLLSLMVLASLLIAAFTFQLLSAQEGALQAALTESNSRALALLANHVERDLLSQMRRPFQVLASTAAGDSPSRRLSLAGALSPAAQRILLLDAASRPRASWSRSPQPNDRQVDYWLSHRAAAETSQAGAYALHVFIERLSGGPVILGLQPVNERSPDEGWILVSFDLRALLRQLADPLLKDFMQTRGGRVELQDGDSPWDEEALHEPLTQVLPGWLLSYRPDPQEERVALAHSRNLVLAVSGAAMIALVLATFAAWRELYRERALADLRNRFVANVSHELKTPLSLIRIYSETLLLDRVREQERRHAYLETILCEADRLTDMIDNLLALERQRHRQDVPRLTATDLASTLSLALEQYGETLAHRGAEIDLDLAPDLPPVAHDPQGVTRILLNLVNNALDHGGGQRVVVGLRRDGDWVDLSVTDNGVGLGAEELTLIRRAIARGEAAPSRRGSGLGLALVEGIAAVHGAYVLIDTPEEGAGLRVVVSFPKRATGLET
jgi:signal transduction histidine kinase